MERLNICFALIDQQVIGEMDACSFIYVLILGWLHVNPSSFPNQKELDALIQHGCDEWNKLKEIPSLEENFP